MVQTCIQLNPNYQIYSSTNFLLSFLLLTFNFFFLSAGFKVASGLLRCWRKTYKGGQIWSRGLCRPRCVGISIQRCRSRCCPHCRTRRDGLLEEKLLKDALACVHKREGDGEEIKCVWYFSLIFSASDLKTVCCSSCFSHFAWVSSRKETNFFTFLFFHQIHCTKYSPGFKVLTHYTRNFSNCQTLFNQMEIIGI